jgi:hypothetical protein
MADVDGTGDGKKKRKLRALAGLSVDEFRHPSDQRATDALKKIPGFDKLIAKLLEVGASSVCSMSRTSRRTCA